MDNNQCTCYTCHECNNKMLPVYVTKRLNYKGKEFVVEGVKTFECIECGSVILEAEEAKKIERVVKKYSKE